MPKFNETPIHGTSPYSYNGRNVSPYYNYNGGMAVTRDSGFSVEDFIDGDDQDPYDPNYPADSYDPNFCDGPPDNFGLLDRISKKKAIISKPFIKVYDKVVDKVVAKENKLQDIQAKKNYITDSQMSRAQQEADRINTQQSISAVQPMSTQLMSDIGSAVGSAAGGGAMSYTDMGTGVESDVPTGNLAIEKTLGNVTVTSPKKNTQLILILLVAVVAIFGIVYFINKGKK